MMKILTLLLALFLTLLPESDTYVSYSSWQDVCFEQVDDVEEEAVIRTSRMQQKQLLMCSEPGFQGFHLGLFQVKRFHSVHFFFERQWLMTCALRL